MKFLLVCAMAAMLRVGFAQEAERHVVATGPYHLGVAGQPEWEEFASSTPHGPQLELTFAATSHDGESTLFIRQRNVKTTWNVLLNARKIGTLETLAQPLVRALTVPAGLLRDGENRLTIARAPSRMLDDIVVGDVLLAPHPRAEVLGRGALELTVTAAESGEPVPCRLTLVDAQDALAPWQAADGQQVALRTGVIYTGDGRARAGVAPGRYVIHASRGFEYSVASAAITIAAGETKQVALQLRREVPTPGLVACDTHIHTLTHSKHGDATIDERMLTIAGEGIELAVATDHNHHADYTEATTRTHMREHFSAVVGNEVTTKAGHFNAFPVRADGPLPDSGLTHWPDLLHNIRSVTGAQVVTLNHPRDMHSTFTPFGPENFDASTGAVRGVEKFEVDAIEVVTSAAMQSDVMQLYRDWFALLNHGYRVAAIGASDTHHVSEFILGQSRTYALARDGSPAAVDVNEVCASYRAGRLLVSLGLLTQMTVDGKFAVGDLATGLGDELTVAVSVLGPSWVRADRVELFANGIRIREQAIASTDQVEKGRVSWRIPRPRHDVHLVAIATGPGVTAPYWETPRPYQPTAKAFTPRVIGSTNPVWIDADGDGAFTPARGYAAKLVGRAAHDAAALQRELAGYDEAVVVQARDLAERNRAK